MRKYRQDAATPVRVDYGVDLAAGLRSFPETAAIGEHFATATEELDAAFEARRAKTKLLVRARAELRVANYQTDSTIRSFNSACEIADGGRRGGPLQKALFPDGLTPVVAPVGAAQLRPTADLVDRLQRSAHPAIESVRTEWLPKLNQALGGLEAKVGAHKEALAGYLAAFGSELALREAHFLSLDSVIGQVRATFPGDRAKQNVIFPVSDASPTDSGDPDPAEGTGAPAASPMPAPSVG